MAAKRLAVALVLAGAGSAAVGEGFRYVNPRFGYAIEVPSGFSRIVETTARDGGVARSTDGAAELAVLGAPFRGAFSDEANARLAADEAAGWSITLRAVKRGRASWSAEKGGRVLHVHAAAMCRGVAAYVRIDYERAATDAFAPVATRLVKTLKPFGECS